MTESPWPVQTIQSGRKIDGAVRVPPSKSVTNRALNLALLAEGSTEIVRPLESEDTAALVAALEALGFAVDRGPLGFVVTPRQLATRAEIDCGASGTMLRFLTASLAVTPGEWILDGTRRLRQRPLKPLIAALRDLGAVVECLKVEGFAPLRIEGDSLAGGRAVLDASSSSQFLSALLMASVRAPNAVSIKVAGLTSAPYVDLTLQVMADFGLAAERRTDGFEVEPQPVRGHRVQVEADYSSACYFGAAAAVTGGCVSLDGLRADSKQGDRRFFSTLESMGAVCRWHGDRLEVRGADFLTGVSEEFSDLPDQVPTLAVIAPFAKGPSRVTGVGHLRLKESDRLRVVSEQLRRIGVSGVRERSDSLEIPGVWRDCEPASNPVTVETADDHRIAMAFAVLGLRRPGISIAHPDVVAKSYPGFWDDLAAVSTVSG